MVKPERSRLSLVAEILNERGQTKVRTEGTLVVRPEFNYRIDTKVTYIGVLSFELAL